LEYSIKFGAEKVSFRASLDGHWIESDYLSGNMLNRCMYGKNETHYVLICYGNYSGTIFSRSKGWKKNKLIFKGKSCYADYESKEIKDFTKILDKEYRVFSTVESKKDKYYTEFKATCLKK